MKVLLVANKSDRSELHLFRGLYEKGVELHIVCHPEAAFIDEFRNLSISITPLVVHNRLDVYASRVIRSILLEHQFDILHAKTNRTLSASLFAARGLPVKIVTYRGTMGHISRLDPSAWITYLHPRIDKITCVSEAVRRYLLTKGIHKEKLVTIYKGHDPDWYTNQDHIDMSEFGIPPNSFTVCFAGRMRPVKGVDVLIQSMYDLVDNPSIHLLLIGEVVDERLYRMANDRQIKDRIHFLGFRKDARDIIGKCNTFVMPSIDREGLPRSVIEAMSQKVPPIVSNVGGMPELVLHKECGLVVLPKDPKELAHSILYLANHSDVCYAYGEGAYLRIKHQFNITKTIQEMIMVYQELMYE
jgi:glycosyltransferase involved in cell wall biosynthesis